MAHIYGTSSTAAGAQQVVQLIPDADAIEALGPDITDLTAWAPAYRPASSRLPARPSASGHPPLSCNKAPLLL